MRVTYYSEAFWPRIGGMETFGELFLREVAARGHEVTVITSKDDERLAPEEHLGPIAIHRFDLVAAARSPSPERMLEVRAAVRRAHAESRPDLLHVAFPGVAGYFALQALGTDATPMLLRMHCLWPEQDRAHAVLRRLLDRAGWVTAVSEAALADVRRFHPHLEERSSVAYSGVDPPELVPEPLPWDPPTVAAVGRLAPEKGIDVLLRAVARIDGVQLLVVGDGPERPRLRDLSESLGVADRVRWAGWVPPAGLWEVLQLATVVAVPSREDAFPRIAVEAAHLARPVVATTVGGLQESVGPDVTGVLVPPDDPVALSDAITRVLADPPGAEAMGAAGRARAARFTLAASVEHHLERYASISGSVTKR